MAKNNYALVLCADHLRRHRVVHLPFVYHKRAWGAAPVQHRGFVLSALIPQVYLSFLKKAGATKCFVGANSDRNQSTNSPELRLT